MKSTTIRRAPVAQAPEVKEHALTGQKMSPWTTARTEREVLRRDAALAGRIGAAPEVVTEAAQAYARELVDAGECGYRTAVKIGMQIFPASA